MFISFLFLYFPNPTCINFAIRTLMLCWAFNFYLSSCTFYLVCNTSIRISNYIIISALPLLTEHLSSEKLYHHLFRPYENPYRSYFCLALRAVWWKDWQVSSYLIDWKVWLWRSAVIHRGLSREYKSWGESQEAPSSSWISRCLDMVSRMSTSV